MDCLVLVENPYAPSVGGTRCLVLFDTTFFLETWIPLQVTEPLCFWITGLSLRPTELSGISLDGCLTTLARHRDLCAPPYSPMFNFDLHPLVEHLNGSCNVQPRSINEK